MHTYRSSWKFWKCTNHNSHGTSNHQWDPQCIWATWDVFQAEQSASNKIELQDVCCKMEAHTIWVACVEPGCFDFGWSTLIAKESEWKAYHASLQTQESKQDTIVADFVICLFAP